MESMVLIDYLAGAVPLWWEPLAFRKAWFQSKGKVKSRPHPSRFMSSNRSIFSVKVQNILNIFPVKEVVSKRKVKIGQIMSSH